MRCNQCRQPLIRGQRVAQTRNGIIMHAVCYDARIGSRPFPPQPFRIPPVRPPVRIVPPKPRSPPKSVENDVESVVQLPELEGGLTPFDLSLESLHLL